MDDLFLKVHDQLPVFSINAGGSALIYAPGYLFVAGQITESEIRNYLANPSEIANRPLQHCFSGILEYARAAVSRWEMQARQPFLPECLTIHAGSDCNMHCTYCYSKVDLAGYANLRGFPDAGSIRLLFDQIVRQEGRNQVPVTIVYHGSGEPTYHWKDLAESVRDIKRAAERLNLDTFFYVATNGVLSDSRIDWLVANFDLIGISCDGPPGIQEKQRIRKNRVPNSIERVCRRIARQGGRFDVRVTVTRETLLVLPEIVHYLVHDCSASTIRLEPVYLNVDHGFVEYDADDFFLRYSRVRDAASAFGAKILYSGVRLKELHGPFCDILRNNLRLTADKVTRNCFCFMNGKPGFITGRIEGEPSAFRFNPDLPELKYFASGIPAFCSSCINQYHCSRGCPDFCIMGESFPEYLPQSLFRCRLHQLLSVDQIRRSAHGISNYKLTEIRI